MSFARIIVLTVITLAGAVAAVSGEGVAAAVFTVAACIVGEEYL